ncbi:MAG: 30S ribosomal protein S21 [Candidatus Yanofskybacteria bacterium]|nr:30S ribosomal protein S21 [Candidatus Yanofskybacteria bacterium]
MVQVTRKPNESVGSLLRRFSRLIQQTGTVIRAKKRRYFEKRPTERVEKNRAIMGEALHNLRQKLEKMGKYDEETFEEEKKKLKQELDF